MFNREGGRGDESNTKTTSTSRRQREEHGQRIIYIKNHLAVTISKSK